MGFKKPTITVLMTVSIIGTTLGLPRWAGAAAPMPRSVVKLSGTLANAGFDNGMSGWQIWPGGTNFTTYGFGMTGNDPYEGSGFSAINTTISGGGIFQDTPATIAAGSSYCVDAQMATQGSNGGARGTLALWLIGSTTPENSNRYVSNLGGGNNWTREDVCVTATGTHTAVRVQFYPDPYSPTMIIDAVEVKANRLNAAGFNGASTGWQTMVGGNFAQYSSGTTNPAYEGSGYGATNAAANSGGGIYQDVYQMLLVPGLSYCASAYVASQGAGGGASGDFVLWFLGDSHPNVKAYGNLPGGNGWTRIQTCGTVRTVGSYMRVQFYPHVGTSVVDAVELTLSTTINGNFDQMTGWQAWDSNSNFTTYPGGVTGNDPYDTDRFAATNTSVAGGGFYQDITTTVNVGDSYCLSAELGTQGPNGGARGSMALWFIGSTTPEASSKYFANLGGGNNYTAGQVCNTAKTAHSAMRVQFYPDPNSPTMIVDGVRRTRNLARSGGFNITPISAPNLDTPAGDFISDTTASLNWVDTSSVANRYRVERSDSGGAWHQIVDGAYTPYSNGRGGAHADRSLTAHTPYCWRVIQYNPAELAYSNTVCATTLYPALPSVRSISATATDTTISVTWGDNATNEDGYKITYYKHAPQGQTYTQKTITVPAGTGDMSYTITGLETASTYSVMVAPFKAGYANTTPATAVISTGGKPVITSFTTSNAFTQACDPGAVTLSWNVSGATHITITNNGTALPDGDLNHSGSPWIGSISSGNHEGQQVYLLTATNATGQSTIASVTINPTSSQPLVHQIALFNNTNGNLSVGDYNPTTGALVDNIASIAPGQSTTITLDNCVFRYIQAVDGIGRIVWTSGGVLLGYDAGTSYTSIAS